MLCGLPRQMIFVSDTVFPPDLVANVFVIEPTLVRTGNHLSEWKEEDSYLPGARKGCLFLLHTQARAKKACPSSSQGKVYTCLNIPVNTGMTQLSYSCFSLPE